MHTASTLLPLMWAAAVVFGLLANHYTSTVNAKFLSWNGLGLVVASLGSSMLIAGNASSYPEWQTFFSLLTYALAGCAGGVLSFYTKKLYTR